MPHYIYQDRFYRPGVVYEAPLNEKAKELREQLDIDEETGYPRQYSWRTLSKLGQYYRPDEAFIKLSGESKPGDDYTTKIGIMFLSAMLCSGGQFLWSVKMGVPVYAKPQYVLSAWIFTSASAIWYMKQSAKRQAWKNGIYVDYIRKHPERFETIHRPKLRELLFEWYPIR